MLDIVNIFRELTEEADIAMVTDNFEALEHIKETKNSLWRTYKAIGQELPHAIKLDWCTKEMILNERMLSDRLLDMLEIRDFLILNCISPYYGLLEAYSLYTEHIGKELVLNKKLSYTIDGFDRNMELVSTFKPEEVSKCLQMMKSFGVVFSQSEVTNLNKEVESYFPIEKEEE